MRKYFKLMLIALCVCILSASMVFAAACSSQSVSAEGYAEATKTWNDAKKKTATDDIEITVALPNKLSKNLKLIAKGNMTRTYNNDEITKIDGAITYVSIEGLGAILNNKLVKNALGNLSPKIKAGIDGMLDSNGSVTLNGADNSTKAIAAGSIYKDGDMYYLEGGVYVDKWFGGFTDKSLNIESGDPADVEVSTVDDIINLFIDKDKYFDSISLYQIDAADITVKDDTTLLASFDGAKAMKWLLEDILYKTFDQVIGDEKDDELVEQLEARDVDQATIDEVMRIFGIVKGYINQFLTEVLGAENTKEAIENFINFDGNTEATITFNEQNISTFSFDQKVKATLTKDQLGSLTEFAQDVLSDFDVDAEDVEDILGYVDMASAALFTGEYKSLEASIDIKVTTTLKIK